MLHSGQISFTCPGVRNSTSTPMVRATPAYWWYSSIRSRFMASRMLPTSFRPTGWPVSSSSVRYSSTEYLWIWPTE